MKIKLNFNLHIIKFLNLQPIKNDLVHNIQYINIIRVTSGYINNELYS